jgi:signal transduction protein with GAF and PtsI domain
VLDTLGQPKQFSPSEVENVKTWAKRLAEALNRSEVVVYEERYRKLQDAKAAAAAAESSAPPPAEGDAKEDE